MLQVSFISHLGYEEYEKFIQFGTLFMCFSGVIAHSLDTVGLTIVRISETLLSICMAKRRMKTPSIICEIQHKFVSTNSLVNWIRVCPM